MGRRGIETYFHPDRRGGQKSGGPSELPKRSPSGDRALDRTLFDPVDQFQSLGNRRASLLGAPECRPILTILEPGGIAPAALRRAM